MTFHFPTAVILILVLCGCRGNREKDVVGVWSTATGQRVTLDENHGAHTTIGQIQAEATWSLAGDDVTLVPKTLNGKSVAELKAKLASRIATLPPKARQMIEDLDKPSVFLLSSDGKSMTTDKKTDKTSNPSQTITKTSA